MTVPSCPGEEREEFALTIGGTTLRRRIVSLVVLACFGVVSGCGGSDSSNGGMTPSTCVSFLSLDDPTTFTAVPGSSACSTIEVRILLNDVLNVFGGGFDLTFDPAVVQYNGMDTTDSHLASDGRTLLPAEPAPETWPGRGEVPIGVTRTPPLDGVDFDASQEFCSLSFKKVADSGSTVLTLSKLKLQDPDGNDFVGVTASGGTFTIQ